MARLYMDEQFPKVVSGLLRSMGHDVLTVQEAGNGNLGIPDEQVLSFAISDNRAVVTINRYDFIRLHRANSEHCGIIVCTNDNDPDRPRMATRLNEAISDRESLKGELIRVVRPSI
jgi:predicted nuclease of predicted toxin-antitoxin system